MTSSNASSPCRIEWRPSPLLQTALALLGLLAAIGMLMSALPLWLQVPGVPAALVAGWWLRRRERAKPSLEFVWAGGADVPATLCRAGRTDAVTVERIQLRGPIAVAVLRGAGRRQCLVWWPDTLPIAQRRALKLAAATAPDAPTALSLMAG